MENTKQKFKRHANSAMNDEVCACPLDQKELNRQRGKEYYRKKKGYSLDYIPSYRAPTMKICDMCQTEHDRPRSSKCFKCERKIAAIKYAQTHKESIEKYRKEYYSKNKEQCKIRSKDLLVLIQKTAPYVREIRGEGRNIELKISSDPNGWITRTQTNVKIQEIINNYLGIDEIIIPYAFDPSGKTDWDSWKKGYLIGYENGRRTKHDQ